MEKELSIKVTIANRLYPLKISTGEEENIQKAVKLIQDKLKDYEQNYSVRDKQDLLAMCVLQLATEQANASNNPTIDAEEIDSKLQRIDQMLIAEFA